MTVWTSGKLGNDADQYEVHCEGRTIAVTHDDEGGANARLISAAPDLREAALESERVLQATFDVLATLPDDDPGTISGLRIDTLNAITDLRAAIQKAKEEKLKR